MQPNQSKAATNHFKSIQKNHVSVDPKDFSYRQDNPSGQKIKRGGSAKNGNVAHSALKYPKHVDDKKEIWYTCRWNQCEIEFNNPTDFDAHVLDHCKDAQVG